MISQMKNAATMNKCASVMGHFTAMTMRRYGDERIAQRSMSRATLEATGRRQRAIICPVLPWRMPWSSISA